MSTALNPRTRMLLEAPIAPTLLRLAAPNVLVMLAQAGVGLIETYFVGKLGTDALAGMALVFPVVMLMQMTSAGAMGGGIASAIARALGARRRDDADALVLHALAIAAVFALVFTVAVVGGGRWLYARMGGTGGALDAALVYSNWVFAGAFLVWLFNTLSAVIRGTGNMAVPAYVTVLGALVLVPLSPLLIFGWGPLPGLGIAGGAIALMAYYFLGSLVLAGYLWSPRSLLRPSFAQIRFRWALFKDILRVGLVGAVSTVATNVTIGVTTALVGGFGTAAIAGYGTASRLEYLLVPLVFGLGAPLVAMVGTCIGAGQRERALRATWIGAAMAFAMAQAIGLWAAAFPRRLVVAVQQRSGHARSRWAVPAHRRAGVRFLRPGPGAVLCLARGRAPALAGAGQHRAAGRGRDRRLAGVALGSGFGGRVCRAGCGAGALRVGQCLGHCGRRLVRPRGLAAQHGRFAQACAAALMDL